MQENLSSQENSGATESKLPESSTGELEKKNKLEYSLFLGCVIPNRYPMIERASRTVFDHLDIGIKEMNGASCCPAPGVFRSVDKALWLSVGARNLSIAEENKADIITLCNGCYGTLLEVDHNIKHDKIMDERINDILAKAGRHYDKSISVRHIVEVLYQNIGLEEIKSLVTKPLGLRVAVHYGCHLLKPSHLREMKFDPDNPTFFDEIVEAIGCTSLEYSDKMLCCGAGGAMRTSNKNTSLQFTLSKLRGVRNAVADCIVVACPFCQLQLDLGQLEVKSMLNPGEQDFKIPVVYITQLLGLAMGLGPEELGMIKPKGLKNVSPFTPFDPLLKTLVRKGIIDEKYAPEEK